MAYTHFTGPVASANGFESGTSSDPIAVTTADTKVSSSYVTTSATTGDTRLMYDKLTFTSTGSGETARFFSVVTGAGAAAGGTINGAHISTEINTTGTISGAANAIRATLGGSATSPGGTLAVIQLDTNYTANVSLPANASFIRVSDSGSNTGEVPNLMTIDSGPAATIVATGTVGGTLKGLKINIAGTTYYVQAGTTCS